MAKWTIQVFFTHRDDDNKASRCETFFQVEALDIGAAYAVAEKADWKSYEPVKFGYILAGWHDDPTLGATKDILKKKKGKKNA